MHENTQGEIKLALLVDSYIHINFYVCLSCRNYGEENVWRLYKSVFHHFKQIQITLRCTPGYLLEDLGVGRIILNINLKKMGITTQSGFIYDLFNLWRCYQL
jgi:hypothetical protein